MQHLLLQAKPDPGHESQPSNPVGVSYREIYQVINGGAFAVLVAGVITAWVISRSAKKFLKMVADTPWFGKVPAAVTNLYEDLPELTDKIKTIAVQADDLLKGIESLEKRAIVQEVQLGALKDQLSELIRAIRKEVP